MPVFPLFSKCRVIAQVLHRLVFYDQHKPPGSSNSFSKMILGISGTCGSGRKADRRKSEESKSVRFYFQELKYVGFVSFDLLQTVLACGVFDIIVTSGCSRSIAITFSASLDANSSEILPVPQNRSRITVIPSNSI